MVTLMTVMITMVIRSILIIMSIMAMMITTLIALTMFLMITMLIMITMIIAAIMVIIIIRAIMVIIMFVISMTILTNMVINVIGDIMITMMTIFGTKRYTSAQNSDAAKTLLGNDLFGPRAGGRAHAGAAPAAGATLAQRPLRQELGGGHGRCRRPWGASVPPSLSNGSSRLSSQPPVPAPTGH